MIRVNLVPSEILAKAAQKQQILQLALVGIVVLAVVMMVSAGHFMQARNLEAEFKTLQQEYSQLEAEVKLVENLEKQAKDLRTRLKVVEDLLKGRSLYPVFMSDFIKAVPGGIWVKSMSTNSKGNKITINLSAEANSTEEIREWIARMTESGRFSRVEMGAVSSPSGTPKVFVFTLKGVYAAKL